MKERYIQMLKDFYRLHNRSPKRREFNAYSSQFNKVFGSWNKALVAAELPILREQAPSREKLIQSLKDFYQTYQRSPRAGDCQKKNRLYDTKTYLHYLNKDSWAKVLKAAGLPVYIEQSKDIGLEESALLEKIKKFIIKNKITSALQYNQTKGGLPSSPYLVDRYGSWTDFLIKAGFEVKRFIYNKEFFTNQVNFFVAANCYPPGLLELAEQLAIAPRVITSCVGTYSDFIRSLGWEPRNTSPETVEENPDQLKELYVEFSTKNGYLNGAPARVLDASDEIYNSDVFVLRFGSINELREACGFNVVQRVPKRYTQEGIKSMLLNEYKRSGKRLTVEEVMNSNTLPSLTTILRYFQTTSIKEVWNLVLKEEIDKMGV